MMKICHWSKSFHALILYEKKMKMILPTSKKKKKKKKNGFKKKQNITLKNQNDLEKLHLGWQEAEIKLRFSSSLLLLCIYMKLLHTKTKQEGRIWNFQGHLSKEIIQELVKNNMELPEVIKNKSCGVSWGLGFRPYNFWGM